jgi:hypothetical protein
MMLAYMERLRSLRELNYIMCPEIEAPTRILRKLKVLKGPYLP